MQLAGLLPLVQFPDLTAAQSTLPVFVTGKANLQPAQPGSSPKVPPGGKNRECQDGGCLGEPVTLDLIF